MILAVISSPISHLRLSARSDLRYLFVLATVHYDVLSDGLTVSTVWMSARRLLGLVGGFDTLTLWSLSVQSGGLCAEFGLPCFSA